MKAEPPSYLRRQSPRKTSRCRPSRPIDSKKPGEQERQCIWALPSSALIPVLIRVLANLSNHHWNTFSHMTSAPPVPLPWIAGRFAAPHLHLCPTVAGTPRPHLSIRLLPWYHVVSHQSNWLTAHIRTSTNKHRSWETPWWRLTSQVVGIGWRKRRLRGKSMTREGWGYGEWGTKEWDMKEGGMKEGDMKEGDMKEEDMEEDMKETMKKKGHLDDRDGCWWSDTLP